MFSLSEIFDSDGNSQKRSGINKMDIKNLIPEESFRTMISFERKRTERSGKPFLLMLLDVSSFEERFKRDPFQKAATTLLFNKIAQVLVDVTRDIDIKGWHETGKNIGILFTETSAEGKTKILEKIKSCLFKTLKPEQVSRIGISCHWYPINHSESIDNSSMNEIFYSDPSQLKLKKKISSIAKRSIDIAGSIFGLMMFSPVFLFASFLIKFTSKGPVFFKQERMGKSGQVFKIYKFRTMTVNNDESAHKEYVKKLIHGQAEAITDDTTGKKVYKLANDSRITPIGKFLRKTSLDEVPQFLNVLLGDMSLVGPRPPIPYEVAEYDLWHKRRVLETKPGITGYWQVEGRSTTNFDGMVRMDISYITKKSFWFDLKVIIKTPIVLFTSRGAY